ncbi:MAG: bacteriohemerythrin [Bacteroidales bacterium]|nr:bacteriohemerythrin [Bacteroidales bacterium]
MKKFKDFSIIAKFVLILLMLFILFIINFAGIRYFNRKKDIDDYLVSAVIRNTMLTNRISFLSEMVANGKVERKLDLENAIEAFDETLYFLREGGKVSGLKRVIEPPKDINIQNKLDSLQRIWRPFRANAEILLNERINYNNSGSNLSSNAINAISHIETNTRSLTSVNELLVEEYQMQAIKNLKILRYFLLGIMLLSIAIAVISILIIKRFVLDPIKIISLKAKSIADGNESDAIDYDAKDEIGRIAESVNNLADKLQDISVFVTEVGNGNFTATMHSISENDFLGKALRTMKNNFQEKAKAEDERREEDRQRNWIAAGLAKFAEILRNEGDNIEKLADNILSNLTKYMQINQAGLFILNDERSQEVTLDLVTAYAYNRKKFLQRQVMLGEGLVGTCALERETIYRSEIPEDYIQITSGLGGSNPRYLLLVPLKMNDEVFGVIELASFNPIRPYEIEFVESLGESIASTLSGAKINQQTQRLLSQSQEQAEELHSQEEEMRQNIEELQATQEEMSKKDIEMTGLFDAINHSIGMYVLSLEGSYSKVNNIFLMAIGMNEDDVKGKNHYAMVKDNFANSSEYENFWNELLIGKHFRKDHTYTVHDRKVLLHESYTPVRDPDGNITKILVLANKDSGTKNEVSGKETPGNALLEQKEIELKKTFKELQTANEKLRQIEKLQEEQRIASNAPVEVTPISKEKAEPKKKEKATKQKEKSKTKTAPTPAPAMKEESKLVEWNKNFTLGIQEIDDQHQNLFGIINNLYNAVNEHKPQKQLHALLKELLDYTQYHFGTEEKYFDEFGFKESGKHINEHQSYTKKLTKLVKDVGSKKSKVSFDMMNFIGEWIEEHIENFDKEYVKLFQSKGLK